MRPYSMDLRERVLKDCDGGMGTKAVAEKYSVSASWVRRLKRRRREGGRVGPRPRRHGRVPASARYAERIAAAVEAAPDATLEEHLRALGLPISRSTLARALLALGLSRKKSRSGPPSRTGPT